MMWIRAETRLLNVDHVSSFDVTEQTYPDHRIEKPWILYTDNGSTGEIGCVLGRYASKTEAEKALAILATRIASGWCYIDMAKINEEAANSLLPT
jgi:hypothetical protein